MKIAKSDIGSGFIGMVSCAVIVCCSIMENEDLEHELSTDGGASEPRMCFGSLSCARCNEHRDESQKLRYLIYKASRAADRRDWNDAATIAKTAFDEASDRSPNPILPLMEVTELIANYYEPVTKP